MIYQLYESDVLLPSSQQSPWTICLILTFFVCSQQHPVNPEIKDFLDKWRECVVCVFQPCAMCLFEQNFPLPPIAT